MDDETLERIFYWVDRGLNFDKPVHLHLFGEPLLHPRFAEMAAEIWRRYRPKMSFSTNGKALTPRLADKLATIRWAWITLSPHDEETARNAAHSLSARQVMINWHGGPDHNWAGQVNHEVKWRYGCEFALLGKMVVRWNGDLAACCITDGPEGVIGSVWDNDVLEKTNEPFELCAGCHLTRDESESHELVGTLGGVHRVFI
jgi:hypothetical protein